MCFSASKSDLKTFGASSKIFKYSIREKLSGDLVLPTYTFAGACYKKVENTST